MVDIVSDAGSGRTIRRVSASFRLRSPSSSPSAVEEIHRTDSISADAASDDAMVRVCLEIEEDKNTGAIVYRLINALSGELIREWRGDEAADARKYLQENRIQLLDRRV
jgi:hypothetical protein